MNAQPKQNSILVKMQLLPNKPPLLRRRPLIPLGIHTLKRMKQHSSIEEPI